jgi:hypothetical protein
MRPNPLAVPSYLSQAYWWAYVHPELSAWLPQDGGALRKRTLFGGLYQLVTLTVRQGNTP